MRRVPRLALLVLLLLLTGCAGWVYGKPDGPAFVPMTPPDAGSTLVYVWRRDSLRGVDPADLRFDGEKVGAMKNGEYLAFLVDPGTHELRARLLWLGLIPRSWNGVSFRAVGGETVYLRIWAGYQSDPQPADTGQIPGQQEQNTRVALFMGISDASDALPELARTRRAPGS